MTAHFTTVGHSNRGLDEFLDILCEGGVDTVIDVRSFPKSRANPVFNADRLPRDLANVKIGYQHVAALGGRRPKQPEVDETLNAMWRVRSFQNYADYALGDEFGAAFDALREFGRNRRLTLMCAEAVWWRCHRRIIADYLIANGHDVEHLMGAGRIDPARLTPGARKTLNGKLTYPAP